MKPELFLEYLDGFKKAYPEKFASEDEIFSHIRRGDHIFVASGCGEPQYLVQAMIRYVESNPKAFFDAEIIHIYSLGLAPYAGAKYKANFRHNSFFIGNSTRDSINAGMADYTPISLSQVPALLSSGVIQIDVALIQTSMPDPHHYLSLGVSVDVVKAATEKAKIVIAQINPSMPTIHGDGFIHIKDVDFIIPYDEPLLEVSKTPTSEVIKTIGKNVARLVQDGDTIQVGWGGLPNAVMASLYKKKNLGVHTELLSDGLVDLLKAGVIDNSRKTIDHGKTVAAFCMGNKSTYDYLDNNPSIALRTLDYTNNQLIIARIENMVAINSTLEIDLSGQATSESIGGVFYSGVGGHQDFMRGALFSRNGKTILALKSTSRNDTISRIVPALKEQAGVTLNRADTRYVVTEYGIAYLHGKNIRERAMALIAIAHPKFRPWLIEEAKKRGLIFKDQAFIPGKKGEYPEDLETYITTKTGVQIFIRPVKISDESLLKDFFYSLSDKSIERRFMSSRKDMPHEILQNFVIIDYTKEVLLVVIRGDRENPIIVGVGQYGIDESSHTAEVAFAVRDDQQNSGIGFELLKYLTYLAKRQGLLGFTADVLVENKPMLHVFEKGGFDIKRKIDSGVYELSLKFKT
ncbi:MAG: acetyl-CoA hydrolase [Deltaproteobacteria bacterium HGW-Deltaproteobacteria-2]|jgi:acyl-CoA hydrolase/RimJ/RimL family protein N-acetyltransferase|nr:MAG: acetyl-CoA hydrolase [Deltaproteobacteria bacterium HGW-Deltaproteobacteria-2]